MNERIKVQANPETSVCLSEGGAAMLCADLLGIWDRSHRGHRDRTACHWTGKLCGFSLSGQMGTSYDVHTMTSACISAVFTPLHSK